ncbi:unnamed protein product, partial [Brassica oleracea]
DLDNSSTVSGEASASSTGNQQNPLPKFAAKKKRNLPGMPDPDSEVIALSPKTLLATNRFVCEICNKGFQRDQNLQLHRRGHNLPWKLRQKSSKQVKKKVYVCPEATCVHHDPSRALGDLTGIKKHFCRKHGEKKWKCDKCSKKYAVVLDWKTHSKICGTKERDSFVTHRAFCDALAEESARSHVHSKKQNQEVLTRKKPDHVPSSAAAPVETQSARIKSLTSKPSAQPAMSATALLQKAAQMGATSSGGSLLRGLGIVSSTSPSVDSMVPHGLALGLPCGGESSSGLKELMMGNSSVFGPKQTTLDFLGLGRAVGNGGGPGNGLSSLVGRSGSIHMVSGEFLEKDIGRT